MTRLFLPAALVAALLVSFGLPGGPVGLVRGQSLTTGLPAGTVFFESATVAQDEALEAHIPDQGIGWAVNEDTSIATTGSHTLRAIATDHAGNTTVSSEVVVNVRQAAASPALVAIASPVSNSGVSKAIGLVARPTGETLLSSVQFKLDGANIGAPDTSAPFTYSWDTTTVPDGAYAITAVATAAGGMNSTSAPVILRVYNQQPPAAPSTKQDAAKPTVSISSPRSGSTVEGVVPLRADASDDVGLKRVQFRLDDNDIGPEINKPPFAYLWNSAGSSAAVKVAKGRDWLSPMGFKNSVRVSYYAKPSPALRTPDYYVQVTLDNESNGSPDEFVWLMIRRTNPGTYYGAGWYASGVANDCYIFKVVDGRYSDLANRDCGFVDGDVIKFSAVGDTLTLSKNGSVVVTAAGGGAISAVGTGGFGYGNIRNPSDDTSGALALDDFLIVDGGGGSTSQPPAQTPAQGPIAGPPAPAPTPRPTPEPPPPPPPPVLPTTPVVVQPGNHGYFNSLVARPEHWRSFSLRDPQQITQYRQGRRADVTYSFPSDPDPRQQDAAKVVIADFPQLGSAALAAAMSESDTILITAGGLPAASNVAYKVDNEVMTYVSRVVADGTTRTTVLRGQHGTRPAAHAAGTPVGTGTNNLQSQVRIPMGTEDGHSYLITWDAWYGAETKPAGLTNWKTFQFAQGTSGDGSLGLEVRTRFDGGSSPKISLAGSELAQVDMRRYLAVQDSSLQDQLGPTRTAFAIKAETWTRYWVFIEHVVGDWDRVSLWMADTTRGPVQVLDRVAFEAESHTFRSFWIEFNTSTDRVVPNRGTLVSYVRNIVMLRDVTNPAALMAMPLAATVSTTAAPLSAPKNLRIVQAQ